MKTFKAVHLGAKYERAFQAKNWDTIIALEKQIDEAQSATDDWLTPWIVKGRNFVRAKRGLPLVRT